MMIGGITGRRCCGVPPAIKLPLCVAYDVGSHVLLPTSEPPRAAVSDERVLDLFLRVDPGGGGIVGFECLEFARHVQDPAWLSSLPDVGTFWVGGRSLTLATVQRETWAAITAKALQAAVAFGRHHV